MKIQVNGINKEIAESSNIKDLVEHFCAHIKHIIVECNGNIVKEPEWSSYKLKEGDAIELVNFVGGG